MKLRQVLTAVGIMAAVFVLCVFTFAVVAAIVDQARLTYATPEMQSCFLRTYTIAPVLERFRLTTHIYSGGDGSGSGAGYGFATHEREFHYFFVMHSNKRDELMRALVDSLSSQLNITGAQIISQTGSMSEGIQFRYVAGPASGAIVVDPPSRALGGLIPFLCPDEINVSVNMRVEEKWTRP
jgi:hypothetical protein